MHSIKLLLQVTLLASVYLISSARELEYLEPEINFPGLVIPNLDGILDEEAAPPKPCCLPKQWQGNVTSQSGWVVRKLKGEDNRKKHGKGGGFRAYNALVYVDETKKKVAGRVSCHNDTCGSIVVFGGNNTADTYLFAVRAQKCWHRKSPAVFRPQCLPANATFGGSAKLGPLTGGLGVQVWRFHGKAGQSNKGQPQIYVAGKAVVTETNCVPVVVQEVGAFRIRPGPHEESSDSSEMDDGDDTFDEELDKPHPHPKGFGGHFMASTYFSNFEPSVKDPKVFDPPSYCKSASETLAEEMEFPEFLDRFVEFM